MDNEYVYPGADYIGWEELIVAMKAGPIHEASYYESAIQRAVAHDDAAGIYTVLVPYLAFHGQNNDRPSALRLAERFADLNQSNAMMCRYLARTVYDVLQDAPLALRYLDRGLAHSYTDADANSALC